MRGLIVVTRGGGPRTVLCKAAALASAIQNRASSPAAAAGSAPVYLAFRPPVREQPEDPAAWSEVFRAVYTRVRPSVDLRMVMAGLPSMSQVETIELETLEEDEKQQQLDKQETDKQYSHVVLGGTFDRLHNGHKILLSSALLRCTASLTVGVTAPAMLASKTLPELIQPVRQRLDTVEAFLGEVAPYLEHKVVEIEDPFGPSVVDPQLECIVGSQETERGCLAVNKKRKESGLSQLDVHIIKLASDTERQAAHEEEKLSSSSLRSRLLGTRLRPVAASWAGEPPFIIGLTGGSASGKTSLGRRLAGLGAGVVDCDRLGHSAYLPGTAAFGKIVEEFGKDVVGEDGQINRRALGPIVFSDKSKLQRLNQIVWPEIMRMAEQQTKELADQGRKVVVLDAAVLLEAGWDSRCHEVWVCVVPRQEAVKRIMDRDGKTEEEAARRIDSQMSNQERVDAASTVFCTLWEPEETQRQAELAWNRLNSELFGA